MSVRKSNAEWLGTLKEGEGTMNFSNYSGPYTFASRFEEGEGTNPEELVGAAIGGCFSMFLSGLISEKGLKPEKVETNVQVELEKDDIGPLITSIKLVTSVKCEGLERELFDELVKASKEGCPISRLYQGGTAQIKVEASLEKVKVENIN